MIYLNLGAMTICAGLFWWGGFNYHNARRFFMPLFLTAVTFILTHFDIHSLLMLPSIGFLTLGYGDKSPLRHCFGDGWGRGIWGLLVALALSLGLFLYGHVVWYYFAGYLVLNFIFENALKKLPQQIGDPIIGLGFSSILLIIH